MKRVLDRVIYTDCCVKHQNKWYTWVYTKMADIPVLGFQKYWTQKLTSLKYECHTIMNKYREAASVVQQVYKYSVTLRTLLDAHWLKWGKDLSELLLWIWCRRRKHVCKALHGKPLFSALYDMYAVRLNELMFAWRWVHRQDKVVQWLKPQWNQQPRTTSRK
jgi:hypothetical protein